MGNCNWLIQPRLAFLPVPLIHTRNSGRIHYMDDRLHMLEFPCEEAEPPQTREGEWKAKRTLERELECTCRRMGPALIGIPHDARGHGAGEGAGQVLNISGHSTGTVEVALAAASIKQVLEAEYANQRASSSPSPRIAASTPRRALAGPFNGVPSGATPSGGASSALLILSGRNNILRPEN